MNRPEVNVRRPQLLCIIGCEGINQEKSYFMKVQDLINSIEARTYDLLFDFAEPFGGDPKCVVQRVVAKSIGKKNKGAVFDYDGKQTKYEEAIDLAIENQITLGYTNYCFDLWLILHKEDYFNSVDSQDDYARELRRAYGLRRDANIKKKEQVDLILNQIDLECIKAAIARADFITSRNRQEEANITLQNHEYYNNPDTKMNNLLKTIFKKVGVEKELGLK